MVENDQYRVQQYVTALRALKTIYASIMSPTFIMIFEFTIDTDVFLKAVNPANHYFISMIAGGLLTALGLGICFRNNATTGGMDIVQKILAKYLHIPYSKTMYLTDWAIIIISGFFINKGSSFYGIEGVIYGSLCVIIIGYVVDAIALNAKTRKTAYIITSKPAEMKQMIFDLVGRGVTESDVRGGYTGNNMVMLICTLEKSEAYKHGYKTICDTGKERIRKAAKKYEVKRVSRILLFNFNYKLNPYTFIQSKF